MALKNLSKWRVEWERNGEEKQYVVNSIAKANVERDVIQRWAQHLGITMDEAEAIDPVLVQIKRE